MAIQANDVPRSVVERIAVAHPRPAYFGFSETCDWPDGVLDTLLRAGLLAEAEQARSIVCPGCERQCGKVPVVRRDFSGQRRVYISCDEEPGLGRIGVPVTFLDRYQSSLKALSNCIGQLLGLGAARVLRSGNLYELGEVKGRLGVRVVSVAISEAQVLVTVGEQREELLQILSYSNSGLAVNRGAINRLASRKVAAGRGTRTPDRSQQKARRRKTESRDVEIFRKAKMLRNQGLTWSGAARDIAGTNIAPNLSFERVRKIISDRSGLERKNLRST